MRVPPCLALVLLAFTASVTANVVEDSSNSPLESLLPPAQEVQGEAAGEKFAYQSDVARLMRVVVNHLYNDREVFVRELLSNANDALEKARLVSLTDPAFLKTESSLNISIIPDKAGKRIVIRDSGVGMTKKDLVANLGTIARSGTQEFVETLEKKGQQGKGENLIGQFGLGFYSSFLVSDRVTVASKSNDDPTQWMFETKANADGFSIAEDPRGDTLGRGTEITLWLKDDAEEYLDIEKLRTLVTRHSQYGSSPIYLWTETTREDPIEEPSLDVDTDGEEPVKVEEENKVVKTQTVTERSWERVNDQAPLWMRDPQEISDEDYETFYKATFKESMEPTAWTHFKGDAGSTSFRALIYIPTALPNDFYSKSYLSLNSLKLYVRRVFITSDLGVDYLPKYLNWIRVFIDADDLPLNVGRDSLQKNRALSQIKKNIVKRTLDLFSSLFKNEPEKYASSYSKFGVALKLGAVEDLKNRDRIVKLLRFETSAFETNLTSLDDYVLRRKEGQQQIYFLAGAGEKKKDLEKSPFVERLLARGYECLYLLEPMDEMLVSSINEFSSLKFQDVAKKGLKFGDEDSEDDTAQLSEEFASLTKYLSKKLSDSIAEVTISTRLTNSPCLVVTGAQGWSGNLERLMASQNQAGGENFMMDFYKKQKKIFEINPHHPLITGLLEKVNDLIEDDEVAEAELSETVLVLYQTALVRSGFNVPDPNSYFSQVEALLRRSLGVSKSAKADVKIHPAPPVDTKPIPDSPKESAEQDRDPSVEGLQDPEDWLEWAELKKGMKTPGKGAKVVPEAETTSHDEL